MLYQNFEIYICKERGSWFAYCDELTTCPEKLIKKIISKGTSPKKVFELAKIEINKTNRKT